MPYGSYECRDKRMENVRAARQFGERVSLNYDEWPTD